MPVAAKSLHMASSFEELMKRVDADTKSLKDKYFKGTHLRMLCTSAKKVLEVADLDRNAGDEEKSFLLYMRYFSMVEFIRKHKDYTRAKASFDQLMMLDHCARVMDTLEQQKRSLQKRYAILKDAKEAEAKEKRAEEEEAAAAAERMQRPSPQKPARPVDTVQPVPPAATPVTTQLSAFKLLEMLQDNDTRVLVMDTRPRQDFLVSHLKSANCISVPEEVLKPGIIAEELSRSVPEESVELFEQRHLVDFVVLLDWRSPDVPENNQAPLRVLKDAIYRWSTQKLLKSEPMVLRDGFQDWLLRFPTHTTNPHTRVPESVPETLARNHTDSTDGVYFPDPDSLFVEAVAAKGVAQQQVKPPDGGSQEVATMPAVDRSKKPNLSNGPVAPNSGGLPESPPGSVAPRKESSNTGLLQVDRGTKLLPVGPFGELSQDGDPGPLEPLGDIRQTENLKQKLLDLTKDQLASEQEYELLRERKAREAEEELRRSVQEREEALQAHIRQLEKERAQVEQMVTDLTKSNQLFQQKLKEKDRELVRIVQLNEEQRRADKAVHKLREERKLKEQQGREEAPKDLGGQTAMDKATPPPRSLKPAAATEPSSMAL